jgi:phosphoglycerate kinase
MKPKLHVQDLQVMGKRVLLRADLNVPLSDELEITDPRRIEESLPTLRWLVDHGARTLLMSHLGRPKGKPDAKYSLRPVAEHISTLLRREVRLAPDCVGPQVRALLAGLGDGDVLLLENLRFHSEEEANEPRFAKELAALGEVYVNDAFGTSHRAHASIVGVCAHIAERAAGFLLEKEVRYLGEALGSPRRPFVAVMGGAKVSDKILVLENLLPKVDTLLVGGGMSYTFFKCLGREIGGSLLEPASVPKAAEIHQKAAGLGKDRLRLPLDITTADRFANDAERLVVSAEGGVPAGRQGLDIGPRTADLYAALIRAAKTVIWNGPMGVFEMPSFAAGTNAVAKAMADATRAGATTVVGGGDSALAIARAGLADQVTHVSTGGGASLEFLEGKPFVGLEALSDAR